MSRWPAPRWPTRVFLRTIGPPQEPRIISTWWKSYSGPATLGRPAAPCARSGTRGGDQGAAKPTRVGELRTRTNGRALHLRWSWSQTGVTRGVTCQATNHLVIRRHDGVLSLPKDLTCVPFGRSSCCVHATRAPVGTVRVVALYGQKGLRLLGGGARF